MGMDWASFWAGVGALEVAEIVAAVLFVLVAVFLPI